MVSKMQSILWRKKISDVLNKLNINFKQEYIFNNLKNRRYDFYLKDYNILIEFDGIQHFKAVKAFGGEEEFKKTQIKDAIKNEFCLKNEIKLLRISYKDDIDYMLSKHL